MTIAEIVKNNKKNKVKTGFSGIDLEFKLKQAIRMNRRFTAYDFTHWVVVKHDDFTLRFHHSTLCESTKDHLVVYHEHGTPMVFNKSDLNSYSFGDHGKNHKKRTLEKYKAPNE